MQLIRNRPGEQRARPGVRSVVTIGNFDGMHAGHQALLGRCDELATPQDQTAVLTFEPLPQAYFRPDAAPPRLATVYQKLAWFREHQVGQVWLMRFDGSLSQLSARQFASAALHTGLAARHVVVGEDFRFGHKREGDVALLRRFGAEFGFEVDVVLPVMCGSERISSSAIRRKLASGDFAGAASMLGRPFRMEGHVVKGKGLGRKLGYPTANLRVRAQPSPLMGVFAVFAREVVNRKAGPWWSAVSSIGYRPTVCGTELLLEVHIFDLDRALYGARLEVEFVAKLREESHFESLDELVLHMRQDEAAAREVLAGAQPETLIQKKTD